MGRKMTALALAALLVAGLSGCSSGSNVTTDRSYGTRGTYGSGTYNNGTYGSGSYNNGTGGTYGSGSYRSGGNGLDGDIGNAMDDAGNTVRNAGDALTGDRARYEQMLENGFVHDTDGYLLDGENRHD